MRVSIAGLDFGVISGWGIASAFVSAYITFKVISWLRAKLVASVYSLYIAVSYHKAMLPFKRKLFATLADTKKESTDFTVLEIGIGPGSNFKFYPKGTTIIGLDPNIKYYESYLKKNLAECENNVTLEESVNGSSENMSAIPDNSVDAVLSTVVLCSVTNVEKSLSEIKRVLKPGGRFFYMEHVCAFEGDWLRGIIQKVTDWTFIYAFLTGGCKTSRKLWKSFETAGFSECNIQKFNAPLAGVTPVKGWMGFLVAPHCMGNLRK